MSKKEVKEYLKKYRLYMAKAQRLKADAEQYTASAVSIRKEMEECVSRSREIESLISTHENLMEREILIRKYIYGDTHEEIAEMLNYSARNIQRLADKAAEALGESLV